VVNPNILRAMDVRIHHRDTEAQRGTEDCFMM